MVELALAIAIGGAVLRGLTVVGAMFRTALYWKRFVRFKFGWVECLTGLEPFVLLACCWRLAHAPTAPGALVAWAGAGLVLVGWALIVWTYLSWPSIYAGHAVLEDHELVSSGAYGWVRHPVYLACFAIWAGLALGTWSLGTGLITLLYVVPAYHLYARSEEAMMIEAFGDEYRGYRQRVPMWIPGTAP